ncbi:CaiB/BaiF CoA transferase family protein [Actinospongicola halichondriae]|uniref:CaiB/BaiF CoA transferase family protein n=1 Tax=Actinospongicola halichondriae TaxID=3236844 RepID=UPI003D4E9141
MTNGDDRRSPLEGITVLDLTRVLSGPICGRALSDLGARVVKVEPPAGDLTRFSIPRHGSISGYYAQQNSGKENVSIDLDTAEGRALLRRLASSVDIVLENFRPGVCAKWGIGYDDVAAQNPGVIYASITGFGQTGPWADRRAYAVVSHAVGGLTHHQLEHQETVAGEAVLANDAFSHGDVYTGLLALSGVLAALHQRHATGRGQQVDVCMIDAMLFINEHAQERLAGETEAGDPAILGSGWSPVVEVANGQRVSVAGDPGGVAYESFLRLLGRDDLLADPAMRTWDGRTTHGPRLRDDFRAFAALVPDADSLMALLDDVGLAAGLVQSVEDLAASEFVTHRGSIVEVDDRSGGSFAIPQAPWRFSDARAEVVGPPAWRGEHNRAVCRDLLGATDQEIDDLETAGALVARPPKPRP